MPGGTARSERELAELPRSLTVLCRSAARSTRAAGGGLATTAGAAGGAAQRHWRRCAGAMNVRPKSFIGALRGLRPPAAAVSPGRLAAALASRPLCCAAGSCRRPGSEPGTPTIAQAAALDRQGALTAAPSPGAAGRGRLRVRARGCPSRTGRTNTGGGRLATGMTGWATVKPRPSSTSRTGVRSATRSSPVQPRLPRGAVRASKEGTVLYRLASQRGLGRDYGNVAGSTCVLTGDRSGTRTAAGACELAGGRRGSVLADRPRARPRARRSLRAAGWRPPRGRDTDGS